LTLRIEHRHVDICVNIQHDATFSFIKAVQVSHVWCWSLDFTIKDLPSV